MLRQASNLLTSVRYWDDSAKSFEQCLLAPRGNWLAEPHSPCRMKATTVPVTSLLMDETYDTGRSRSRALKL